MRQRFLTNNVTRLEVLDAWPDMPNLVTNPSGTPTSVSPWIRTGVTTTVHFVEPDPAGIRMRRTNSAAAPVVARQTITLPAGTGRYMRAQAVRVSGISSSAVLSVQVFYLDAAGVVLTGTTPSTGVTTNGATTTLAASAVPDLAVTAWLDVRASLPATTGWLVFKDATFVCGPQASVVAASMTPARVWVNVMGPTHEIKIERSELQVGLLTADVRDIALDPAADNLVRRGRPVRCRVLVDAVWEELFTGTIDKGETTYELRGKVAPAKRARITITATDPLTALARTPRPDGVATIDELPFVLDGIGVPWNVNGSTGGVDPDTVTVVTRNDNATAVDQVAVTRDSVLGFAWVDRRGVLQVWDAAQIPATPLDTLDDATYSALSIDFDSDRCINTVSVVALVFDEATQQTEEVTYGPFTDPDSVREWGPQAATFTVQGIDETGVAAYAAAILSANAVPVVRVNSMTLPLRTIAELEAHVLRDLYDLVTVSNVQSALTQNLRIVSVSHRITGKRWAVDLGFAGDSTVAPPQVVPSPGEAGMTQGQRLRPTGEVSMWFGAAADVPAGWLILDGSTFSAGTYPKLATLLGGTTLPNLVDRFPIGAGVKALGSSGGAPTTALTHLNLPNAAMRGSTADGSSSTTFRTGGTYNTAVQPIVDASATPVDVMPPWRALHFIIRAV